MKHLQEEGIPVAVSDIIFYLKYFVVFCCCNGGSQYSTVGLPTMLQTVQSGVRIPIRARDFFPPKTSRPALGPTQPLIKWFWGFFLGEGRGLKHLGCDFNHASLSSVKVRNEWSYFLASIILPDGMDGKISLCCTNESE